jgi:hypothetical protein
LLLIAQDVPSEHFVKKGIEAATQRLYGHTCYVLAAMESKKIQLMVIKA